MCRRRLLSGSITTFIIMRSSKSLLYISLLCRALHGRSSFPVTYLQPLSLLQRLFMMRVSLHISLRVLRQSLSVFQYVLPIIEAPEPYLQQHDEYYLHPRWKGSRYLHQQRKYYLHLGWKGSRLRHQHRYRTKARGLCRMRTLQEAKTLILHSLMLI